MKYGNLVYMLIPSHDPEESAAFYKNLFGWSIRHADHGISFDNIAGDMSGRWVTDRAPVDDPGYLIYIAVEDAAKAEAEIVAHGGQIVEAHDPSQYDVTTTFRDPSGNLLGTYEPKRDE